MPMTVPGHAVVSTGAERQTGPVQGRPIGQERDERTYTGIGPHPADPRAAEVAAQVAALIARALPGTAA